MATSIAGATVSTKRLSTTAAVYQSRFDANDWSGELMRYRISVDANNKVSVSTDDDPATLYAGKVLDANGVKALAAIPSREVLIAQVAGLLKSPIQRLAGVLAAVAEKKGGGAEAAAPEAPAAA